MATTSISIIREQSEAVKPPRALWVPFDLGRPLGSAGDPDFQKDVIRSALGMLATATAPTIEDFPRDAPGEAGPGVWACPVSFAKPVEDTITERLVAEVTRMAPWSLETRRSRGRTLFGVTGAQPDAYETLARAVGSLADGGDVTSAPDVGINWTFPMPILIRHMADDLRTLYHEAVAAQPGPGAPNHAALSEWIFSNTALGEAFTAIADHLTAAGSQEGLMTRGFLIPEGHYQGGSAFPHTADFGDEDTEEQ